ncbi:MAG TPA: hypothetical protein PK495_07520, partial [Bacteroidales bacterium]|nr:hypothetical protein [Bacteroidales bacterium]
MHSPKKNSELHSPKKSQQIAFAKKTNKLHSPKKAGELHLPIYSRKNTSGRMRYTRRTGKLHLPIFAFAYIRPYPLHFIKQTHHFVEITTPFSLNTAKPLDQVPIHLLPCASIPTD